jgi:hypothetical protein
MPKRIQNTTKAQLISVPLPVHGTSYTVISHQFVIDYAYQALAAAGFSIVDEEYRCNADGQIAQGIYKLNYNNDPELSMMFAWTNSYNKQVKFKCVVGGYINTSGTVMTSGDIGTWSRKHTGSADTETKDTIDTQIKNAHMYYDQLVADKAAMEGISLNRRRQAQLLGILFAEYQILTTEQASVIRQEMDKPSNVFADTNSLWAFYNYATIALQYSHPRTWMEDQRILHYFINTVIAQSKPAPVVVEEEAEVEEEEEPVVVDPLYVVPNQTNILDQIAEVEMQLPDNQVVQEEVEIEPVMHQSEEIILSAIEEQNVLIKDEDGLFEEVSIHPAEQEIEECIDDIIVHYTDPAGNTFEAPIVTDEFALEDNLEEANFDMLEVEEEKVEDNLADFDLDFVTDDTEEDEDDIPDFF